MHTVAEADVFAALRRGGWSWGTEMAFPATTMTVPASFSSRPGRDDPTIPSATLSARERDVLLLVAEGCRDQEIAARLFVSHHTVANHVRNILGKLGVSSRAAAVAYAARSGML